MGTQFPRRLQGSREFSWHLRLDAALGGATVIRVDGEAKLRILREDGVMTSEARSSSVAVTPVSASDQIRAPSSARVVLMLRAELRQALDGNAVLLVDPGELEPELPLCERGCGIAAGNKHAQRRVTVSSQFLHAGLQ